MPAGGCGRCVVIVVGGSWCALVCVFGVCLRVGCWSIWCVFCLSVSVPVRVCVRPPVFVRVFVFVCASMYAMWVNMYECVRG